MNHIHQDRIEDGGNIWKFQQILGHTGPLDHMSPGYKNSLYNLEIEWENGEITFEPLSGMIADDEVTVAKYAKEKGPLETKGWKKLKRLANRTIKLDRLIKQAKLRSFCTAPKYMYGFKIPSTYKEALAIDKENGDTKWADATALEMLQLREYYIFIDKGIYATHKFPRGFQRIKVHLVFADKYDGRHKSRLVSRGDTPEWYP